MNDNSKSTSRDETLDPKQEKHVILLFAGGEPSEEEVNELMAANNCDNMCKYSCQTSSKQSDCDKSCKFTPGSKCGTCLTSCKGGTCKDACMMSCQTPTCKATCQWGTG